MSSHLQADSTSIQSLWAEPRAWRPIFCVIFVVCTLTEAVCLSATFLAIPAEEKRTSTVSYWQWFYMLGSYFLCEGMLMFWMWWLCLLVEKPGRTKWLSEKSLALILFGFESMCVTASLYCTHSLLTVCLILCRLNARYICGIWLDLDLLCCVINAYCCHLFCKVNCVFQSLLYIL